MSVRSELELFYLFTSYETKYDMSRSLAFKILFIPFLKNQKENSMR